MFTVMVTGSRTWDIYDSLEMAFDVEAKSLGLPMVRDVDGHPLEWNWSPVGGLRILHGACPDGADDLADLYAAHHGVVPDRRPAKWTRDDGRLNRAAGFQRNAAMIAERPDLVVGLVDRCVKPAHQSSPHGSHGSIHALNLAQANEIRTVIYYRRFRLDRPMLEHAARVVEVPDD